MHDPDNRRGLPPVRRKEFEMNPFPSPNHLRVRAAYVAISFAALVAFAGCPGKSANKQTAGEDHAHDDHDHAAIGPHDGHILEFGSEVYHAELTHDDESNRVGVYILGSDAKTLKPIKAASVTINVAIDGKPAQYELLAAGPAPEPEGTASYFELVHEPLCKLVAGKLDAKDTKAELRVTIDGVPHTAKIDVEPHDHHDHDHDHK
jgi:hypothetical protein